MQEKKNNKGFLIAGLILIGFVAWRFSGESQFESPLEPAFDPSISKAQERASAESSSREEPRNRLARIETPSEMIEPMIQVSPRVAAPLAAPPEDPVKGRRPLPPGAVPYRIDGNLMIAYGDIVLGRPQASEAPAEGFAEMPVVKTWSSKTIPYWITPKVSQSERILRVIAYFNENTPIRFVPFAGEKDAVIFEAADEHCRSYLGRIGGHQPIYLSAGCTEPEIAHEIMHALGFIHEQSRPDRDRFIHIHWDRIEPDKADQFDFVPVELAATTDGRPFDYRSIMIYEPTAFARTPGEIVLESRTGTPIEPVRTGLSREDLERIELLYK